MFKTLLNQDLCILWYWLAEGWSLILAEPTRPPEPTQTRPPGDSIFLSWTEQISELTLDLSDITLKLESSKVPDLIQIKIKMPNPIEEHPASSKAQMRTWRTWMFFTPSNQDREPIFYHWCIKDPWPYPIQDQYAKPQSGSFIILQMPKWGLEGHGCVFTFKIKIETQNLEHWCFKA